MTWIAAPAGGWLRSASGPLLAAAAISAAAPLAAQQSAYGPPAPAATGAPVVTAVPPGIPPVLANAAAKAVRDYPAVSAARSGIRASAAEIRAARWMRYPSLSVEAVTRSDRIGALDPFLRVEQPLWTGGRISANIDRARATRDLAIARMDETVLDVALRLSTAYFEIARAVQLEAILRDSIEEHQRLVESMERRVKQEVSPTSDLELARSRAAQVQQELATVTAQRYSAMQRFFELVGDPNYDLGPVPDYSAVAHHPPIEGAIKRALACSPSIRRFSAEAEVAEAEADIAEASILPQVGVQVSHNRVTGTQAGLSVRAQTNGGLSGFAAADAARLRREAAGLQISVAERQSRETVVLDVVENTSSKGRIESSQAAAKAAGSVTESYMRQFITGRRTWLDVMNAVREANAARIGLTEATTSAMASAARLRLQTCEWQPDGAGAAIP